MNGQHNNRLSPHVRHLRRPAGSPSRALNGLERPISPSNVLQNSSQTQPTKPLPPIPRDSVVSPALTSTQFTKTRRSSSIYSLSNASRDAPASSIHSKEGGNSAMDPSYQLVLPATTFEGRPPGKTAKRSVSAEGDRPKRWETRLESASDGSDESPIEPPRSLGSSDVPVNDTEAPAKRGRRSPQGESHSIKPFQYEHRDKWLSDIALPPSSTYGYEDGFDWDGVEPAVKESPSETYSTVSDSYHDYIVQQYRELARPPPPSGAASSKTSSPETPVWISSLIPDALHWDKGSANKSGDDTKQPSRGVSEDEPRKQGSARIPRTQPLSIVPLRDTLGDQPRGANIRSRGSDIHHLRQETSTNEQILKSHPSGTRSLKTEEATASAPASLDLGSSHHRAETTSKSKNGQQSRRNMGVFSAKAAAYHSHSKGAAKSKRASVVKPKKRIKGPPLQLHLPTFHHSERTSSSRRSSWGNINEDDVLPPPPPPHNYHHQHHPSTDSPTSSQKASSPRKPKHGRRLSLLGGKHTNSSKALHDLFEIAKLSLGTSSNSSRPATTESAQTPPASLTSSPRNHDHTSPDALAASSQSDQSPTSPTAKPAARLGLMVERAKEMNKDYAKKKRRKELMKSIKVVGPTELSQMDVKGSFTRREIYAGAGGGEKQEKGKEMPAWI